MKKRLLLSGLGVVAIEIVYIVIQSPYRIQIISQDETQKTGVVESSGFSVLIAPQKTGAVVISSGTESTGTKQQVITPTVVPKKTTPPKPVVPKDLSPVILTPHMIWVNTPNGAVQVQVGDNTKGLSDAELATELENSPGAMQALSQQATQTTDQTALANALAQKNAAYQIRLKQQYQTCETLAQDLSNMCGSNMACLQSAVVDEQNCQSLLDGGKQYYIGPEGGCYYLTTNGNKEYVDRSICGE